MLRLEETKPVGGPGCPLSDADNLAGWKLAVWWTVISITYINFGLLNYPTHSMRKTKKGELQINYCVS